MGRKILIFPIVIAIALIATYGAAEKPDSAANAQMPSDLNILVLTDLHYIGKAKDFSPIIDNKMKLLGPELIKSHVAHIQRKFNPDIIILSGDLVNDGNARGAEEDLWEIRHELDRIGIPFIALPGNHDGDLRNFQKIFGNSAGIHLFKGYMLFVFTDPDGPSRTKKDLDHFEETIHTHPQNPIIVFQHYPICPITEEDRQYAIQNADEVMERYKKTGVLLSLSGHNHKGQPLTYRDGVAYITAPAACNKSLPSVNISLKGCKFKIRKNYLKMSEIKGFR